jgi:hypothetical protein
MDRAPEELTVHALASGERYRVIKPFRDHAGNAFAEGEILTFTRRDYLPYHDGHTLFFEERTMWLSGEDIVYAELGAHLARER